jgi:hypothetical protein
MGGLFLLFLPPSAEIDRVDDCAPNNGKIPRSAS